MNNINFSLLHTAWTEEEKMQLDQTINFVEEYDEKDFFTAVCLYLYSILKVDYLHIGLTIGDASRNQIFTVARLSQGQVTSNAFYNLNKSPFKEIYEKDFTYIPFGLSNMFPESEIFNKKEYESYMGIPLFNADNEPLGNIVLLHNRIIEKGGFVEALVNALVPRIESELSLKQMQSACF